MSSPRLLRLRCRNCWLALLLVHLLAQGVPERMVDAHLSTGAVPPNARPLVQERLMVPGALVRVVEDRRSVRQQVRDPPFER